MRKTPAIEGWFEAGKNSAPHLIGTQCQACKAIFFPPEHALCRNPACMGESFQPLPLARTGKLWSYTTNEYQPPPPFVSPTEKYQPFAVAAVELAEEKIIILGQVPRRIKAEQLKIGMEMELVVEELFTEADEESGDQIQHTVWKWQPRQGQN